MIGNSILLRRFFLLFILITTFLVFHDRAYAEDTCILNLASAKEHDESWILKRGINLSASWRGDNPQRLSIEDYRKLSNLGITFVRLPVAELWLISQEERKQNEIIRSLHCDIVNILNSGLAVVLDFHPSRYLKPVITVENSDLLSERLLHYWKILGTAISSLPEDKIYISLLNEPPNGIEDWWGIQENLLRNLRLSFPKNTFVATVLQGNFAHFQGKAPYDDPNIIYDFHFYRPIFFTHHNASWIKTPLDPREKTDRVRYPSFLETNNDPGYEKMRAYVEGNWNREKLEKILKEGPIAWRAETGAKIVCLEFGVYKTFVDPASRARWLKDVREIFEAHDIPWAMWDYNAGFGLYDKRSGKLDTESAAALGLHVPK